MYKFPGMGAGLVAGAGGAHTLAVTGFDYAWWIFFGMVFLLAGVFLFRAVQRHGTAKAKTNRT
jgi:cbb3-type cytochrome oxidase subunit 3